MRRAFLIAILSLFAAAAGGAAADGGPSPGVLTGFGGVVGPGGQLRYVAVSADNSTVLEAVRVRDGRVLRYRSLHGYFGIPLVAYDGSVGGLSHDAKTLVLSSWPTAPGRGSATRFAVLRAADFRLLRMVTLRGSFSFDAIAPDGSTLYLIEYQSSQDYNRYRVRAYDLAAGKLLPGSIVDKREPKEAMTGSPVTRVTSPDGAWEYTLYGRADDKPFVHALDTARRVAFCLDLDGWHGSTSNLSPFRLELSRNGRRLFVVTRGGLRVLAVATPRV